jgi:hypothetical protein
MTTRQFFSASVFAAMLGLAAVSMPAMAIVGGTVDANVSTSDWTGVVSITIDGNTYSGVLIGDGYVLTAAHVVSGVSASSITVNFNSDGSLSESIQASSVTVYSGYTGTSTGSDGVWHDDLAIIKLSSLAPSTATVYDIYTGTVSTNTSVTIVGYGTTGSSSDTVNSSTKRVGTNTIDYLYKDDDSSGSAGYTGSSSEIVLFDYDTSNSPSTSLTGSAKPTSAEAAYGSGDSGSPMFVNVNGEWVLYGIASFTGTGTNNSGTSVTVGGATSLAAYADWITSVMAVPEPQTYAMMLAGLGLVGVAARRRRS